MATRLRQVVLVAGDLDRVETEIVDGLAVEACVHDLGVERFGLRNVLFPIGDTLLEEGVDGRGLLDLTLEDLQELGITGVVGRGRVGFTLRSTRSEWF